MKIDWSKTRARSRIARQGTEAADDGGLLLPRSRLTIRPGKATLRAELQAAEDKITRSIKCRCGHEGKAVVPAAKANARLRCSVCGEYQ